MVRPVGAPVAADTVAAGTVAAGTVAAVDSQVVSLGFVERTTAEPVVVVGLLVESAWVAPWASVLAALA